MAIQVVNWVMHNSPADLTGTEQSVAMALASYASDDGGRAFPSVATLCDVTHWSERTVRTTLQSLVEKGVIAIEQDATHKTPAVYCFPLYRGAVAAPQRAERGAGNAPHRGADSAERGAASAGRGAFPAARGAAPAPNTSLTVKEPSEEPETSRARDRGHLTVLRERDERADDQVSREPEPATVQAPETAGEDVFALWERRHGDAWRKAAAGAGLMPNRMPPAMPRYEAAG